MTQIRPHSTGGSVGMNQMLLFDLTLLLTGIK